MSAKVLPLCTDIPAKRRREAQAEARRRFVAWWRWRFGGSVTECAAWLDVSASSVERWVAGKRRVPGWLVVLVDDDAVRISNGREARSESRAPGEARVGRMCPALNPACSRQAGSPASIRRAA